MILLLKMSRIDTMHATCPAISPSPVGFLNKSGSSRFRGSDGCSGRNSVYMTNRAALFARSIQCLSSTVMVTMLSMHPSIDASVAVMSTAKGYAVVIWIVDCCLTFYCSKYMCGEFRLSVFQGSSRSRSFSRSIVALPTVVYSDVAGVMPKW